MSARRHQPTLRSVRTPEAIQHLIGRLEAFDPTRRKQGLEYLRKGAVVSVNSSADHIVQANVDGTRRYALTWIYARERWTSRCACATGTDCKHAYAAGLAWIDAVAAGVRDGRDPGEEAPSAEPTARPRPVLVPEPELVGDADLRLWLYGWPENDDASASALDWSGLRVRLDRSGHWGIETRQGPEGPWRTPPQRWMTDLLRLRPADLQLLPPADAALALALAAESRLTPAPLVVKRPLPPTAVAALLRTAAARPALVLPEGEPLTIEPEALVLQAEADVTDADRLGLQLVTPDGRPAATAVLVAPLPEPLYWFEGRVWPGPPPVPSNRLPKAALHDARLLPRLRAAGLRLPEGVDATLQVVPLRPRLKCWLTAGFDGTERELHAQLTAESIAPPCRQHWTGEGWRWRKDAAPPPRLADEPVRQFDLTAAQMVSSRFAGFRLMWDGWAEAWVRPVTEDFAETFLDWHAGLRGDVEVDLSPELASLLGAPLRPRVELSLAPLPDSEQDWFDLTVDLGLEDTTLSAEEVALLLKARGKWVHLPRHGWRRVATEAVVDDVTAGALSRLGLGVDDVMAVGRPAHHRLHALQLARESEALTAGDEGLRQRVRARAAALATRIAPEPPAGLRATLRPYQREGFQFLDHLATLGFGGVLADDMGLGKTVQTLAWLLHLADQRPADLPPFRALVVCPKSVIHGWLTETARFTPGLSIGAFDPGGPSPAAIGAAHPNLLVANYTQLRRHAGRFRAVAWDAVVLDEGQFIKNPGSQVAVAARALASRHRLVLTGTPIENRLTDLWSLFAFAQPGLLGDQAGFRRQYHDANPDSLSRLHRRVQHFLLRRTKAQAAPDLPPRTEDEIVVELEGGQRRLYDAELKRARAELLGVKTARELDAVRFHVLASLLRLRQICCHPALVDPAHAGLPSAKLEALLERVEELAEEGHQVLVFSQFVQMLHLIRDRLAAAGIGHLVLTGATEDRASLVDTFQSDPTRTVFLLSLKAAGFGLNLTAASYAILFDPWWNPAAEAQAIDRIHRIGQTKPVIAYRIIAADTIEQKIRVLQREKAGLAAAVVQEESLSTVLDLESLRQVLG